MADTIHNLRKVIVVVAAISKFKYMVSIVRCNISVFLCVIVFNGFYLNDLRNKISCLYLNLLYNIYILVPFF